MRRASHLLALLEPRAHQHAEDLSLTPAHMRAPRRYNKSAGRYHAGSGHKRELPLETSDAYAADAHADRPKGHASRVPLQALDGRRDDGARVTQASVVTLNVNSEYLGWMNTGFSVPPHASGLALHLTLASPTPTKFKVRHVSSC